DAPVVAEDDDLSEPIPLPPMARLFAERGPGLDRTAQWLVVTSPEGMTADLLAGTVRAVLDRHEVLRSRLVVESPGAVSPGAAAAGRLAVEPLGTVAVERIVRRVSCDGDWSSPSWRALLQDEAAKALAEIDASAGQMLRVVWFDATGGQGRLLVAANHLVVDGVSWRVLLPDLAEAADQLQAGRAPALAPVGTSLRRWLDELATDAARPERVAELDLWRGIVEPPADPVGTRPLDPKVDLVATADTLRVEVPEDLSRALLTSVPAAFRCGVDDVLLTALVLALAQRRRTSTVVRLEGHGRQEELVPGADLTRTVGWFTTVHPVRFDLSGGTDAAAALRLVKQARRTLPDQGIGYTLLRWCNEETAAVLRDHPADEVGFNYLGRFESSGTGTPWAPAPELAELQAALDPEMPLLSALELNSLVAGEQLQALFTFATGVVSTEDVRQIAEAWQAALHELHAQAVAGASGLTPSDVPLVDVRQEDLDGWQSRFARVGDVWPLTPLQHGLLFHSMLGDNASASYQTQFVFRISGPVDAARLRAAAQALLDRHPNLRVAFVAKSTGEPVQVVVDGVEVPFRHLDLTGETDAGERLAEVLAGEREARFEPDTAPLLRFTLVTLSPTRSELALTAHHVLFDGWSLPMIEQELMRVYAGGAIEPVQNGYREFLRWQSRQNEGVGAWAEELSGVAQPTLLAASVGGSTETSASSAEVGQVDVQLTRQEAAAAVRQAAACGITPNVLVQGAWAVVLAQLTGSSDVVFGSSVTVRPPELPDAHTVVGMFTNTVPVRARCAPADTLQGVFQGVQDAQTRTLDHYHVGLGDIQLATGLTTLFDTMVIFESFPVDRAALSAASASAELTVTGIRPFAPTHYPLAVLAAADPLLSLTLQYQPDALDAETARDVADRLAEVLRQFAGDARSRVAELDVLSGTERQLVVHDWNDTALDVPFVSVPEQFARQAAATPDAIAIEAGERLT
ncbi:MAG TPA: condensation domain-containing protein, partial [Lentzea sp.]